MAAVDSHNATGELCRLIGMCRAGPKRSKLMPCKNVMPFLQQHLQQPRRGHGAASSMDCTIHDQLPAAA